MIQFLRNNYAKKLKFSIFIFSKYSPISCVIFPFLSELSEENELSRAPLDYHRGPNEAQFFLQFFAVRQLLFLPQDGGSYIGSFFDCVLNNYRLRVVLNRSIPASLSILIRH